MIISSYSFKLHRWHLTSNVGSCCSVDDAMVSHKRWCRSKGKAGTTKTVEPSPMSNDHVSHGMIGHISICDRWSRRMNCMAHAGVFLQFFYCSAQRWTRGTGPRFPPRGTVDETGDGVDIFRQVVNGAPTGGFFGNILPCDWPSPVNVKWMS